MRRITQLFCKTNVFLLFVIYCVVLGATRFSSCQLMLNTMFIFTRTIVHLHIDHFFFIIVASFQIIWMIATFALCVIFLLHALVFCTAILKPHFNLFSTNQKERGKKEQKKYIKKSNLMKWARSSSVCKQQHKKKATQNDETINLL